MTIADVPGLVEGAHQGNLGTVKRRILGCGLFVFVCFVWFDLILNFSCLFVCSFVRSFVRSFVCLFVCLFCFTFGKLVWDTAHFFLFWRSPTLVGPGSLKFCEWRAPWNVSRNIHELTTTKEACELLKTDLVISYNFHKQIEVKE